MPDRSHLFRAAFWIALAGSYLLSVLPGETVAPLFSWSDKLNHLAAFVVLGFLLRRGWSIEYWLGAVLLILYGCFIEVSQLFAIHRSAEWADVVADTFGTMVGLIRLGYQRKT